MHDRPIVALHGLQMPQLLIAAYKHKLTAKGTRTKTDCDGNSAVKFAGIVSFRRTGFGI